MVIWSHGQMIHSSDHPTIRPFPHSRPIGPMIQGNRVIDNGSVDWYNNRVLRFRISGSGCFEFRIFHALGGIPSVGGMNFEFSVKLRPVRLAVQDTWFSARGSGVRIPYGLPVIKPRRLYLKSLGFAL